MATLILEQHGQRRGAVLNGRTVIGRHANSHIVIADRSVSRVHAWVGRAGHTFFISDSGSRTGTAVNGRPVEGRRSLRDGDQIRIGPATITFLDAASLPAGVEPLFSTGAESRDDAGIFVYCACGAPIWAPWEYGGRSGRCRHCGAVLELPTRAGGSAPASDPNNDTLAGGMPSPFMVSCAGDITLAAAALQKHERTSAPKAPVSKAAAGARVTEIDEPLKTETHCGACQSPISVLEATTTCPDCGVAFHADCWTENRGCSSYGCKQVGILDPQPAAEGPAAGAAKGADMIEDASPIPSPARSAKWEPVLLPGSALVGIASLFAFGLPSLVVAVGLVAWSLRHESNSRRLFAAAMIVSAVMAAVGSALSTYWWLHP
jgi:hypothetical protein